MSASAAIQRYKSVQVTTSSPGEILVMLYDGLFRFLEEAREAMLADDRARVGDRINRAHAIVNELAATLNKDAAPELCENLEALYFFASAKLVEANLYQDPERIQQVVRVLGPLREGFTTVVRQQQSGGSR
jgi:flagellar protein FliS